MARYVLGVDGGGTKTHVAIMDEYGVLCGEGFGGPSNYDDVGVEVTRQSVGDAVEDARIAASLPVTPFDAVFLGMAGVVSPHDRDVLHQIAQDLELAERQQVRVDHDCRIALAGGLTGRPGIVQIAGTGTSTFGMNEQGEGWRAGGWGQHISDEGSSNWLGVQAMTAAVRSYDGRIEHTVLQERVLEHLQLAHMNDIMHRLHVTGLSRLEIASMAPLVIQAAREQDAVALNLIEEGGELLADCVEAVARRLSMADGPLEVALVGGLFRNGELFTGPFRNGVKERLPQANTGAGRIAAGDWRLHPGPACAGDRARRRCYPGAERWRETALE